MHRSASRLPVALFAFTTLLSLSPGCSCGGDTTAGGDAGSGAGPGGSGGATGQGGDFFATSTTTTGAGGAGGTGGGAGGGADDCFFIPQAGNFTPTMKCAWNGPPADALYPGYDDVVMTPVVVNMTDDNGDGLVDTNDTPDIAFVSYRLQQDGCCNVPGVLRVLSGGCNPDGTMTEHFAVGADEIEAAIGAADVWLDNSGGLAAGDIDADGSVDLVATLRGGGTIAFERTGTVKWVQAEHPSRANRDHLAATTPSIADLDHDGAPEVIQGRVVLNGADGSLKWRGTEGTGVNAFLGPVSAVGDPDLSGTMNVLAGNTLYEMDGTPLWTYPFPTASTNANCGAPVGFTCDGYTATGNFDDDDEGEIVIVRAGSVYILNHDGTVMETAAGPAIINIPRIDCAQNEGGPPTVADFDGDGKAEIGVAGADYYVVVDLECAGSPLPAACSDPGIRWKVANDDCSSRVTGSSVFDFDGDGRAEVIYNDERFFRAFSGTDGAVLIEVPNHSHTRLEMPIVADVDNDGNAEIVFIENAYGGATQGIRVWGDSNDSWVPTRRIWNQHSYHVTNVSETGAIPVEEPPNWLEPTTATVSRRMNNFRQNLPEFDVYSAPDLTLTLAVTSAGCPEFLALEARVCNEGRLVVGTGARVRFYDNASQQEIACSNAPVATTRSLAPGACEVVTCQWATAPLELARVDIRACADNAGYECVAVAMGGNNECHEDNNRGDSTGVGCERPR